MREYWIEQLERIMRPVLENARGGELTRNMPIENRGKLLVEHNSTHLQAIGRGLCGIAPWLELADVPEAEKSLQDEFRKAAVATIHQLCLPGGPGRLDFSNQHTLVDAAFLCHALYRAPTQLVAALGDDTRQNLLSCLKETREDKRAHFNNWLLFAAMIELGIDLLGGNPDYMRIDYAVRQHEQWYKGDGVYGDGPDYHHDYYNSYVIHPMLMDIVEKYNNPWPGHGEFFERVLKRFVRYSAIQERAIAPDGSFPPIGRSLAYRGGAFQALAQAALQHRLDPRLEPAAVRCALTAVMNRTLEPVGTFDANGWLRTGLCGFQPSIGEDYITTGSLYLCCAIFLPLGLPAADPFWTDEDRDWTAKAIWSGSDVGNERALK